MAALSRLAQAQLAPLSVQAWVVLMTGPLSVQAWVDLMAEPLSLSAWNPACSSGLGLRERKWALEQLSVRLSGRWRASPYPEPPQPQPRAPLSERLEPRAHSLGPVRGQEPPTLSCTQLRRALLRRGQLQRGVLTWRPSG